MIIVRLTTKTKHIIVVMKKFLKDMFSSGDSVSAKRVFGGIGFVCSIAFIAIWNRELIDMLLITSASLIGLQTVTDIFKPKR